MSPQGDGEALAVATPAPLMAGAGLRQRLSLVVMLGANVFNILALTALVPVLALIGEHFAHPDAGGLLVRLFGDSAGGALIAQMMITIYSIGFMVGGPIAGFLVDRLGIRNLLSGALLLYVVTGASGLVLDTPEGLLLARFLQGTSTAAISISVFSMIGQRFEGAARSRILGLQGTIVSAAGFISLMSSGLVAEAGGWRGPFALFPAALIMLALVLVAVPGKSGAVKREKQAAVTSLMSLWPFYLMLIPFYMASYMTTVHLSFVLAADGVTSPGQQATIMTLSMVFNIIGALSYATLMNRIGRRWVFVAILSIFALSNLVIGIPNVWGSTIGCWIAGLAGGLMTPFFTNTILDRTEEATRGRAIGLMFAMMYVGDFLNPFLITPLRLSIGNHETFALVGAIIALAAVAQSISKRSPVGD